MLTNLSQVDWAQQLINALFAGSAYALFAVGYTLIFGVLDILNLAHHAVYMLGAFFALALVTGSIAGLGPLPGGLELPFWLAVPLAMLLAGLVGVLLDRVAFAPLKLHSPELWRQFEEGAGSGRTVRCGARCQEVLHVLWNVWGCQLSSARASAERALGRCTVGACAGVADRARRADRRARARHRGSVPPRGREGRAC